MGCRECETACNKVNYLPEPKKPFTELSVLDKKSSATTESYTVLNRYENASNSKLPVFRTIQCNHCIDSVCFVTAFSKQPREPVVYDSQYVLDAGISMIACTFEIPTYEYDNTFTPKVCSKALKSTTAEMC